MEEEGIVAVTAAIVVVERRVLIARRREGGRHPGAWEFPGGKVEEGESPEECLAREMAEEMGVGVKVGERLAEVRHSYPDMEINLVAFRCEVQDGEISDIGCAAHAWVTPEQLSGRDLLPPDRKLAQTVFQGRLED